MSRKKEILFFMTKKAEELERLFEMYTMDAKILSEISKDKLETSVEEFTNWLRKEGYFESDDDE